LDLPANDLQDAQVLEREGHIDDALDSYIEWLKLSSNHEDPAYGRILIHTVRISGSIDAALDLIDRFHSSIQQIEDKLDLYETAVVLTDLISDNEESDKYLTLLKSLHQDLFLSDHPALERLLNKSELNESSSSDPMIPAKLSQRLRKTLILLDLNGIENPEGLDEWIQKMQKENPFLRREPDWLYLVQKKFINAKMPGKAAPYQELLKQNFPQSIETAMLKSRRVFPYPGPKELLENSDEFETLTQADEVERVENYIQAGAFQSLENAKIFKLNLESYDLDCRMIEDSSIYKVIVVTPLFDDTMKFLESLGIKGFRISRIP